MGTAEDSVAARNLELMLDPEEGGMEGLLHRESIGGNAGGAEGYPCAGANFYFDKMTGEIVEFTNRPCGGPLCSGIFKVAVDFVEGGRGFFKVVKYFVEDYEDECSELAIKNLEESVRLYNIKRGASKSASASEA